MLVAGLNVDDIQAQIAVRGEVIYTMAGDPIEDGVVVITDGRIAAVGPSDAVAIPDGHRVMEAAVITPGLIDARSTVGLTGIYNIPHDQDHIERSSPMQPELRAIDAYNVREKLVEYTRSYGITTVHTGHAPGELISGQTMVVKLRGNTVEEALLQEAAAIAATFGPGAHRSGSSPGTRGKTMAMIRQELIRAQEYQRGRAEADEDADAEEEGRAEDDAAIDEHGEDVDASPRSRGGRNLRMEALGRVLDGELPLLITAHRAQDIASALRLAREFDIRIWLDGAAEAYLLTEEIKAAQVPVLLHAPMVRAVGERQNLSFETAARLRDAGIPVAIQSGYEGYVPKVRIVLFEAAIAAAHGLGISGALETITIEAARILGIDDRVGSIEVGKDGDLALYSGDPFEYTTHCVGVIIDGEVVSDEPR
ncbi:MAG: amidohydrolase [Phycisphaerales bacterium]|nr:MAG: amidohydrolase [Phycisphaerales bacterium]